MTSEVIAKVAITKMNKKITNEIILVIQNDHELMYEYLRAIESNDLGTVNKYIGKIVKK